MINLAQGNNALLEHAEQVILLYSLSGDEMSKSFTER
jgi:hypothetical protein